ncbi:hypothetical protein [Rhodopila sp.]|uniref:hypothetical protein n=1 Tax=Rhodopila sp. TaxID=2480087 RepID=UPI002B6D5DD0|nr:hypothetical protein [Rhodopila sp.]HVZ10732.1 hypothetical protein [Rhodopila sp.]
MSQDLLPELPESTASGRIAAIYQEVRVFSGVPYVSSMQRYLATLPGVLEWAWDAMRPALVSGVVQQTAWRLARSARLESPPPADTVVSGLSAGDVAAIRTIAANFVRVSPVNLMTGACLRLLLTGTKPAGGGFVGGWTPPPMLPPMPGNVDPAALPAAERAVLMRFATEMNGAAFVPALYRQLAHWPAVLAWLADALEPLLHAEPTVAAGARLRAEARDAAAGIVARLPGLPGTDPPDSAMTARALGAIDRYAHTSPEMTLFGQFILDALPEG